jgi:drug/metabolite transporter (DMT)-like permease
VLAALRARERPPVLFWVLAAVGAAAAVAFASISGGGFGHLSWADLLLFGAVLAAAVGYAEGGMLSRELGSWQTICWALLVALPATIPLTVIALVTTPPHATPVEWAAFGYLAAVSMFLGFFAWYRGLAIGPMAQVSQTQLVQPVLTIAWAALLLHEQLTLPIVLGGLVVIVCAWIAVRVRFGRPPAVENARA